MAVGALMGGALLPASAQLVSPGALDATFDGDGKLAIAATPADGWPMAQVRADSDRRLYVAYQVSDTPGAQVFHVRRLLSDGAPDSAFAADGLLVVEGQGLIRDMVVQPDDRLVLLTSPGVDQGPPKLLRIQRDGSLDSAYNAAAQFQPPNGLMLGQGCAMDMLPDGRIVVLGRYPVGSWVAVVSLSGEADQGLGSNGLFMIPNTSLTDIALRDDGLAWFARPASVQMHSLALMGDGQFVVHPPQANLGEQLKGMVVMGQNHVMLFDYSVILLGPGSPQHLGVLQRKFLEQVVSGGSIWLNYCLALFSSGPYDLPPTGYLGAACADQQGNFLVGFTTVNTPGWRVMRMAPLTNDADGAFGSPAGVYTVFDPGQLASVRSMCMQPDGKLVVAGDAMVDGVRRVVVARYHDIPDPRTRLELRVLLGGVYAPGTGLMRDDLRAQGLLPSLQPYRQPFFSSPNGVGSWTAPPSLLQAEGDTAVVDFVWVELLSAADSTSVMAARAALVRRDGSVVTSSGSRTLDFGAGAGSYFIRVRHRNHLSATTLNTVSLGAWETAVDFTDPSLPLRGASPMLLQDGRAMLWPGDADGSNHVRYMGAMNDRDRIFSALGGQVHGVLTGYRREDVNLDGQVKYIGLMNDRDAVLGALGGNPLGQRFGH